MEVTAVYQNELIKKLILGPVDLDTLNDIETLNNCNLSDDKWCIQSFYTTLTLNDLLNYIKEKTDSTRYYQDTEDDDLPF